MIASDSGVRRFGEGVPHPRGYGNNARVLGLYVRELRVVALEDAVRKMTSLPAQTFNLRDRGMIREGLAADLVVFDDRTVSDRATYAEPHQYAEGFYLVVVAGRHCGGEGKRCERLVKHHELFGAGLEPLAYSCGVFFLAHDVHLQVA